ncbi:hypothetical protein FND55_11100 [Lactobacillus paracasei subsp. paracasei]|uniref:Uncharacterized protein n=1 Tax=Lacticaseibacillus paracasei NRIC 0644 TaxID=1435038 RepID=A0A0C9PWY1_LACPA|nr:hypothetical protein [Lacticaseibacillus paracasei]KRM98800.1 hypothetical protein FC12_GL000652 [Lacticaseibacillus paracasei subsp. tolerans DSM 20258]GAN36614.1 uncharacterized protein LC0644_1203 [Lacticaseibacillus paracasei NRIC 0644]GAN39382.1 uncharacterized protein LC1917_1259 [Lacticaseibacillus paracasei NRIC 1917]GEL39224.1 hypothetical protein LPA06_20750 [Lacticaseibacillus paracasei subsp. tolerans]MBG1274147.1 hypothetical protein [Lacticaseibacillus paracasei subsp. paracas
MANKKRKLLDQDIAERVKKENEEITKPSKDHFQMSKAVQITIALLLATMVLFGLIYSLIQIL